MDNHTYNQWWQLHLRVAKGETLTPDEKIEYERGIEFLDQEEENQLRPNRLNDLRQLRTRIEQLQDKQIQLKAESNRLDEISLHITENELTGLFEALTESRRIAKYN